MPVSLLSTKYHHPIPTAALVQRPRITALLEDGLAGSLILVSAPPGFGKTTLVAEWLVFRSGQTQHISTLQPARSAQAAAPEELRSCWLSLDPGDTTAPRFWSYVIAAIQTVVPAVGQLAQATLQSPRPLPTEPMLITVLNDLSRLDTSLLLILDDYHVIKTPEIHHSLDFLLEHMPEQLRLLIITREDPPLALSRLRARGQLTEIRAEDLRFSITEAELLLNGTQALALSSADIARLVERTEGWITGLRLAALSLQHSSDRPAFVAAFNASDRFLADYLMDEVLRHQSAQHSSFLLQTSVLERLCGPLCDALLSREHNQEAAVQEPAETAFSGLAMHGSSSQQILDELERANIFLIPLDHQRHWYRYHQLFGEFLRLRLHDDYPERVPLLYQRAISWCIAQNLRHEAINYALAAGFYTQAADLIEALAPTALCQEGAANLLDWLDTLPADLLQQRPGLCMQYAWALSIAGRIAEASDYLQAAQTALSTAQPGLQDKLRAQIATYRLFFQAELAALDRQQPGLQSAIQHRHSGASDAALPLLEALNERELAVLRLMALGLSNREIGAELYLSVNTIRWYASQIFSKLGISGRGAAVARARQLGLL